MNNPWDRFKPVFVDKSSKIDPVLQILEGLEKHISEIPANEPPAPRTPMLAARLCYRNALHLYRSATRLADDGEPGAGRSLSILALEEFGKASIYAMLELELYSTNPVDRGTRAYIDQRVFRCHRCKQGLVYAMEIGWSAMNLLEVFPNEEGFGGDDASVEETTELIARSVEKAAHNPPPAAVIRQRLSEAPQEVKRIQRLMADRDAMEDTKWEGLYVNYEAVTPITPQKVTFESYEEMRGFVALRLVGFSRFFLAEFPEAEWMQIRAAFAAIRLPPTELICPWDPEAEHPTSSKRRASGAPGPRDPGAPEPPSGQSAASSASGPPPTTADNGSD